MIFFRRWYIVLLAASLLPALVSPATAARSRHPAAASYLLQVNGETYDARGADVKRAPASLTKIMTALVVLEHTSPDRVVTVSRTSARETGSRIGLRKGEKLTVRSLLAATLMASANDACRALAEHVAGSQEKFVALMNIRAKQLQMNNTKFTNVCGHDDAGHYSTARDLARLTTEALRHPLFADLVSRRAMRICTVNGRHHYAVKNLNRLIGRYPGARGVKTGTTPEAGQCLVALVERDDTTVLLVLMRARNRWSAAPVMLNAAFAEAAADEGDDDDEAATALNELVVKKATK